MYLSRKGYTRPNEVYKQEHANIDDPIFIHLHIVSGSLEYNCANSGAVPGTLLICILVELSWDFTDV